MTEERRGTLSTADLASRVDTPKAEQQTAPAEPREKPREQPAAEPRPNPTAVKDGADGSANQTEPLFPASEGEQFRSRWNSIQASFVDEPRKAVEQADGLVAEMIKRLATVFADERTKLESQWGRGEDVDTEDLRVTLRRYRSFFDRLLSV